MRCTLQHAKAGKSETESKKSRRAIAERRGNARLHRIAGSGGQRILLPTSKQGTGQCESATTQAPHAIAVDIRNGVHDPFPGAAMTPGGQNISVITLSMAASSVAEGIGVKE